MEIIKKDGSSIELIRFFEYQGKKILIFDNREGLDANGHVTIHICSVDTINGAFATAIQESDMDMIRNIIKTIVSENRNGMLLSIKDLNYNDLNGIVISNDWPLKMAPNYVDLIKMNQPTFEAVENNTVLDNGLNPFNISAFNEQPAFNALSNENADTQVSTNDEQSTAQIDTNDNNGVTTNYEQMYFEQLAITNKLNAELELYKSKIEQMKNIIEN